MQTLNLTLGLHSEIWEDKENKNHKDKIEEALELQGIQYISNTRPVRRGGGAAISLMSGDFTLTRLDVLVPENLEVVWGLVKPTQPTSLFKLGLGVGLAAVVRLDVPPREGLVAAGFLVPSEDVVPGEHRSFTPVDGPLGEYAL